MNLPSHIYRLARSAYRSLTLKPPRERELFYKEILQSSQGKSQAYLQSLLDYATLRVPYYTKLMQVGSTVLSVLIYKKNNLNPC